MKTVDSIRRREFIKVTAAAGIAWALPETAYAESRRMDRRSIPGAGVAIPVIGLGTSHEFDRMPAGGAEQLKTVLKTLVEQGGTLVDTAPGYGDSEANLGRFFADLDLLDSLFVSTKVRSHGAEEGMESMRRSQRLLGKNPLDLMMVHSLVDARTQLENLRRWKEEGRVRYIGITTSEKSGFEEMESLIRAQELDFVQVNYSPLEPEAAERVIPAAAEHGVAVMINRAFGNGSYFGRVRGLELPGWTEDFGCESWAQLSLKYILGNPDVTCVLAATSNPQHMLDNARAGSGPLPDDATRARIADYLQNI